MAFKEQVCHLVADYTFFIEFCQELYKGYQDLTNVLFVPSDSGKELNNKRKLEKILHLLDEKLSLSSIDGYFSNLLSVVSAGTFSFPLFVIPTVTAPSMHLYFTIRMAFMITLVEALDANDGVVLVLTL